MFPRYQQGGGGGQRLGGGGGGGKGGTFKGQGNALGGGGVDSSSGISAREAAAAAALERQNSTSGDVFACHSLTPSLPYSPSRVVRRITYLIYHISGAGASQKDRQLNERRQKDELVGKIQAHYQAMNKEPPIGTFHRSILLTPPPQHWTPGGRRPTYWAVAPAGEPKANLW